MAPQHRWELHGIPARWIPGKAGTYEVTGTVQQTSYNDPLVEMRAEPYMIYNEDDEYYYYVKAVPKVGVAVPEKKVKRITENQPQETTVIREDADLNNINTENDADDILLTRSLSKELGLEKQRPE